MKTKTNNDVPAKLAVLALSAAFGIAAGFLFKFFYLESMTDVWITLTSGLGG